MPPTSGEEPPLSTPPDAEDPGRTSLRTRSAYPTLLISALLVLIADQLTKTLVLETLQDGPVDLISGIITFRLSYNPGGVFGIGQDFPALFLVATVLVVGGILFWARKIEDRRWLIPLGLVLGGGLGNVFDRLFRDTGGRVVDFIDLHVWPIFNLADSAIVIGVLLILIIGFRSEQ
ncbi:MAG TPA: signal peptidase II [Actinomycetota bacterium]|nr:signal peptidase II [Actinomycetota bacterium]